jgi:hypothetical protein
MAGLCILTDRVGSGGRSERDGDGAVRTQRESDFWLKCHEVLGAVSALSTDFQFERQGGGMSREFNGGTTASSTELYLLLKHYGITERSTKGGLGVRLWAQRVHRRGVQYGKAVLKGKCNRCQLRLTNTATAEALRRAACG